MIRECVITSIISKALYKISIKGGGIVKKKFGFQDIKSVENFKKKVLQ
jgi:hypothetical protein